MRATVITDASWCPKTKAGGWAAWISGISKPAIKKSGEFQTHPTTSNHGEILAALNGIAVAYQRGARGILLQSDCLGVQSAMDKPIWKNARALHFPDAHVRYRHVKGHTSIGDARSYVNRWCDSEARTHMLSMRGKTK